MKTGRFAVALLLLFALLAPAGRVRAQTAPSAAAAGDDAPSAPVAIDGATLFFVRGVSAVPAEERAAVIRDRILAVARNPAIAVESVHGVPGPAAIHIMAGQTPIMAVTDADASLEQVSRTELAAANLMRLRDAIAEYRAARTRAALGRAALRTLIATLVLVAAGLAFVLFWRWFDRLLLRRVQARIHSVGIQSFEVMRSEQIHAVFRNIVLAVRTVIVLAAAIVYLGYVLGQWPGTRGAARNIVGFATAPLQTIGAGLVANIPRLAFLAVLFVVIRLALRVIRLFFEAVGRGTVTLAKFDAEWAEPTYKIVRVAIVAFGLIVAYPYIPGSQSEAFKGVTLFIGIVFSLGSSSAVSNIIAGYMMTYRRAFKVGDRVKIGDTVGDVIETRLQVTHLRSLKNEEIVIPNSQILAGEVLNYSSLARTHGLLLHTEVGIGYETSWRQVDAMLLIAAERTEGLAKEPRPFVLLTRLGDFAVTYELNAPCGEVREMNRLYTALHRHILDIFNEHGVQIMTPAYEGDPAEAKVVAPTDWYAPPAQPPGAAAATVSSGATGAGTLP